MKSQEYGCRGVEYAMRKPKQFGILKKYDDGIVKRRGIKEEIGERVDIQSGVYKMWIN